MKKIIQNCVSKYINTKLATFYFDPLAIPTLTQELFLTLHSGIIPCGLEEPVGCCALNRGWYYARQILYPL